MIEHVFLEQIVGAKIKSVEGLEINSSDVKIVTDKGTLTLHHIYECCEEVCVEDISGGDPKDLIGSTVSEFRESSSYDESSCGTWTFYHIVTSNVDITIRWLGTSNGYYSESVDVEWDVN